MTLDPQGFEETDELRIKGAMLVKLRGMTREERAAEGWQQYPEDIPCTEYDNGAVLYRACEQCDKPGTIYASYAGGRWGINSAGEPYERPPTRTATPGWVYPAVGLAVHLPSAGEPAHHLAHHPSEPGRCEEVAQGHQGPGGGCRRGT